DHRGSESFHAAVEDQHAALSSSGKDGSNHGVQVRRVCRRVNLRPSPQADRKVVEASMNARCFALFMVAALSVPAAAQAPPAARKGAAAAKWTVPRTPDGHPDFQGVWSYATLTPLERPAEFAGKEFLSEQE